MPYGSSDRCHKCKAPVDWVYVPELGKARAFDPTHVHRSGDPLATWLTYPDPRTGATFARRLERGEHVDYDGGEDLARLHYNTCPAAPRPGTRD